MKFLMTRTAIGLMTATTVFGAVCAAQASDLVTKGGGGEFTDVEFGSGWYLRGDITYNFNGRSETGFTSVDTPTLGSSFVEADYDDSVGARIGFGYQFSPYLRAEFAAEGFLESNFSAFRRETFGGTRTLDGGALTVNFDDAGQVIGTSNPAIAAIDSFTNPIDGTEDIDIEYTASSFMVNGYVDLPTGYGITPYVGGGIGLGRINYTETRTLSCVAESDETCAFPPGTDGETTEITFVNDTEFWTEAYSVHAGAAFAIDERTTLDIGYSFTAFGDGDEIEYSDGAAADLEGFDIHQVRAGLRYELW